jgi:hypothetical protein
MAASTANAEKIEKKNNNKEKTSLASDAGYSQSLASY